MTQKTLVLIGGGHAHIQVIKDLKRAPDVRLILISDSEDAVYSGMLPAVVANLRPLDDALVNLRKLCAYHSWQFVLGRVEAIQPDRQTMTVRSSLIQSMENDTTISMKYDVLSIDIGSTVRPIPGMYKMQEWKKGRAVLKNLDGEDVSLPMLLATRPIGQLSPAIARFESAVRAAGDPRPRRVLVLGDGAGGFELSCALSARLQKSLHDVCKVHVSICGRGRRLRTQFGHALSRAAQTALQARGITQIIKDQAKRVDIEKGIVEFDQETTTEVFDLMVVATGAAAHPWVRSTSGLDVDEQGFILVTPALHTVRYPNVFAAGDCASFGDRFGRFFPPKAGVYAVRQGPILTRNLTIALSQSHNSKKMEPTSPMLQFKPQAAFLTLLATGDGSAIGSKYGVAFSGTWVYHLKSMIDEKWQAMFQVRDGEECPNGADDTDSSIFRGSSTEGAAALLGASDVASTDAFETQLAVLRRMDEDTKFREELVQIVASRY